MSLQQVLKNLRDPRVEVRKQSLVLLARSRDARALPYLRQVADGDPSADLRYLARKGLQFIEEATGAARPPRPAAPPAAPQAVDIEKVRAALQAPDPRHRLQAARAAGDSGDGRLTLSLCGALGAEKVPAVAASLLEALGRLGDADSLPAMVRWLKARDPRVRANAVEAISNLGVDKGLHYLIPHLRDPDNRTRANAVLALRKHGRVNVFQTLETMLRSPSASMQDSATFCLGRMGIGREVFRLLALAMESRYAVTRNQSRAVLRKLRDRGADRAGEILRRFGEADEEAAVADLLETAELEEEPAEETWESAEEAASRIRAGLDGLVGQGGGAWTDHRETRAERAAAALSGLADGALEAEANPVEAKAAELRRRLARAAQEAADGALPDPEAEAEGVAARLAALSAVDEAPVDRQAQRAEAAFEALRALAG